MEVNLLYICDDYKSWKSMNLIGIYLNKNKLYNAIYCLLKHKCIEQSVHKNLTLETLKTLEIAEINKTFSHIFLAPKKLNKLDNFFEWCVKD